MLLTEEGARLKVADFDAAKRLPHELTEAGLKPLGTKGFVSPEVRTGISLSVETCMGLRFFNTYFISTLWCGITREGNWRFSEVLSTGIWIFLCFVCVSVCVLFLFSDLSNVTYFG